MAFRRKTLGIFIAALTTTSFSCLAKAEDKNDAQMLQEVKVTAEALDEASENTGAYTVETVSTATRLTLSPRETPQSVSVVTRTQMEDFNLNNVNDVLGNTTGVLVERVETDRTYYTARGFDITNFQVDGIGIPFVYGHADGDIDTAIYDRIEILRGANGLMTGVGNPSATVNFIRKRPTQNLQASTALSVGSWDTRRAVGDLSGALSDSGNVRGRTVVVYQNNESYLDRYSLEKTVFYGIVEADITDSTLLTAGYSVQEKNPNSPMWGALPLYNTDGTATDYDVSTSTAADWSYWDGEDTNAFVEITQQLNSDWQIKGVLTRKETTENSKLFYVYGNPDPATSGSDLFAYPSRYDKENTQWIADLYAKGQLSLGGQTHEVVAGVQSSKSTLEDISHYGQGIGTEIPALEDWNGDYPEPTFDARVAGSDFTEKQKSAYTAARLRVTDQLSTVAGARVTDVDYEGDSYGRSRSTSYDKEVTPYLGFVYDLNKNYSVYASYTEIFNPQSKVDINRDYLEALEGVNYEAGIKTAFLDDKALGSFAVFRTKQDNVAEAGGTIPGSTDTYYIAVDGIESEGYEVEASGELTTGWNLAAGYTYLTIEDSHGEDTLDYVPKHLLRLSTTYRIPTLEKLKVGASVNWQDEISREQDGDIVTTQDSYALLNLMARYDVTDQLYTTLNLNNVTDEEYLTSLYWEQGFYGAPRNAQLTVGWNY